MTTRQLQQRLRANGYRISEKRIADYIRRGVLGGDDRLRPGTGIPRTYTEMEYRKLLSLLRVAALAGMDRSTQRRTLALQAQAAELLAIETEGYVYITDGKVRWSYDPPVEVLRSGSATCWPVWE